MIIPYKKIDRYVLVLAIKARNSGNKHHRDFINKYCSVIEVEKNLGLNKNTPHLFRSLTQMDLVNECFNFNCIFS